MFVGNISKHVKLYELEDMFKKYGQCDIKRNVSNVSQTHTTLRTLIRMTLVIWMPILSYMPVSNNSVNLIVGILRIHRVPV